MPSVADRERPAALRDALESLLRASRTPAKQRTVKVSGVIDVICHHAFEEGLDEDAFRAVVQIVSRKTELDQTSVTTLLKNLYPAQRIPADVVITVVGSLGQGKGKPLPGTQNGLVKWLTIIHPIIDDPHVLSRLYGVLFGMLDMISIRTSLCHLLSLITRRKHVKPFRIQQLLELSRSLGNEPALQGLLRIYKDYYPDIILGSTSTSRKSFPPQLEPEWKTRILAIREKNVAVDEDDSQQRNGFKVLRKGQRRGNSSAIPEVHTYNTNEASVTLEGIDSVNDFVEKLDRIEPPGQLISFLTDPLLQKYVDLYPSQIVQTRIELWLSTCLEEQYNATKEGTGDARYLSDILEGLLRHAQYTKSLQPIVQAFLKEYLLVWDGLQDMDAIFGLLSYLPIQPFQDVYAQYLEPAERAFASRRPGSHETLIHFYTDLLRQWISMAVPQARKVAPAFSTPDQRALHDLVAHVSTLSTSVLLSLPLASLPGPLPSAILSFYELLSTSSLPYHIPILLPPIPLLYTLALTPSTTALSRTCGIIGAYKAAFNTHPGPIRDFYGQSTVDAINCCIRDMYHYLWVSRALSTAPAAPDGLQPKALGLLCAPQLREQLHAYLGSVDREYAIQTAFGVSHNTWLAYPAAGAWRELERREVERAGYVKESVNWHKGPVSQRSLEVLKRSGGVDVEWEAYRVRVLEYLEARGCGGFKEFMFASSEALKRKYSSSA